MGNDNLTERELDMGEKYFMAYFSYLEQMEDLTDEEFGKVFRAAMIYAQDGTIPEGLTGAEKIAFKFVKWNIDTANAKKETTSKARSDAANAKWCKPMQNDANGCKEMQTDANSCKAMQTDANGCKTAYKEEKEEEEKEENITVSNETVNADTGKPGSAKPKAKKFVAPTVDQVQEFCETSGLSVDAESFVNFYASKGWMVGSNHMKDWKAACRTWARNDRNFVRGSPVKSQTNGDPLMEYLDSVIAGDA